MWRSIFAVFLLAHGLIHLGFITPAAADPRYPFNLGNSWLITTVGLPATAVKMLGIGLGVMTVIGFALAGLTATRMMLPSEWGQPLAIIAGLTSLLLLAFFWHPWLFVGMAIDLALIVGLGWLGWQPFGTAV